MTYNLILITVKNLITYILHTMTNIVLIKMIVLNFSVVLCLIDKHVLTLNVWNLSTYKSRNKLFFHMKWLYLSSNKIAVKYLHI